MGNWGYDLFGKYENPQKKDYMPDFLQNDFITGSLKVDGAVSIVDPVKQIIGKELLWGQVSGVE